MSSEISGTCELEKDMADEDAAEVHQEPLLDVLDRVSHQLVGAEPSRDIMRNQLKTYH